MGAPTAHDPTQLFSVSSQAILAKTVCSEFLSDQTSTWPLLSSLEDLVQTFYTFFVQDEFLDHTNVVELERWYLLLAAYFQKVGCVQESHFWMVSFESISNLSAAEQQSLEPTNSVVIAQQLHAYFNICALLFRQHKHYLKVESDIRILRELFLASATPATQQVMKFSAQPQKNEISDLDLPLCASMESELEWQKQVERKFKEKGYQQFLMDTSCCVSTPEHSTAFVVIMLLASLKGSNFEFLTEELEAKMEYSKVWGCIIGKQVSPTVMVDKTLQYWLELLSNKVTLHHDFLHYYSSFCANVARLKKTKSTAVQDSAFMRLLLYSSINLGKDVAEVHDLVTNVSTDFLGQLTAIMKKFALCHGAKASMVTARKAFAPAKKKQGGTKSSEAKRKTPSLVTAEQASCAKFMPNVDNLIHPAIYNKMRKWNAITSVKPQMKDWTPEETCAMKTVSASITSFIRNSKQFTKAKKR